MPRICREENKQGQGTSKDNEFGHKGGQWANEGHWRITGEKLRRAEKEQKPDYGGYVLEQLERDEKNRRAEEVRQGPQGIQGQSGKTCFLAHGSPHGWGPTGSSWDTGNTARGRWGLSDRAVHYVVVRGGRWSRETLGKAPPGEQWGLPQVCQAGSTASTLLPPLALTVPHHGPCDSPGPRPGMHSRDTSANEKVQC